MGVAEMIDGHVDLADWLFLIAAILFLVSALGKLSTTKIPGWVLDVGFVLLAVAFLVL